MQFHIPLLLLIVTISNSSGSRIGSSSAAAINTVNADNTDEFPHIPTESRIVGGYDAEIGSYPFFVSWGGCGASLIEKDILLTAAHCIGIPTNEVYIGQSRKFGTAGTGVRRTIIQRVPHPNYNDRTVNYDYMLLKLNSPVNTTEYPPIQLNNNGAVPMNEQILTVIGFGAQNQGSTATPSRLQKVDVNYISTNTCNNPSSYSGQVQGETMFCAGIEGEGGRDACQGDSGGPIFYEKEDGIFEQVGIVSWGRGCAQRNYPGIYSRISGVIDWIQTEVCDLLDSESVVFNCGGNGSSNGGGGGEIEEEEVVDINLSEEPLTPILPAPPTTTVPIRLDITYDRYPTEVGWSFKQMGSTLLSKNADDTTNTPLIQSYRVNMVPGMDAKFIITDSSGDGICCRYGTGKYEIFVETSSEDDISLHSSNGDFSYREEVQLTIPSNGSDEENNQPSSGSEAEENVDEENMIATNPPIPSSLVSDEDNDNESISCVDSSVEFYVDNNAGNRRCDWLSDNMVRYAYLCAFFDVTLKCPKLCNTCEYFDS